MKNPPISRIILLLIASVIMKSDGLLFSTKRFACHTFPRIHYRSSIRSMHKSRTVNTSSSILYDGVNLSEYMVVSSRSNEKVKLLKALLIKKNRDSENLLLLEGHRQIIDAINGGYYPHTLLLSDEAVAAPLGELLLNSLTKCCSSTVYRASSDLIQSISDTVSSQGVVASFSKPQKNTHLTLNHSPIIVLMDRPNDPGNLGTIIRTAYGMGVDAVIIVDGCDPWSPKVLRSAMGMCLKLPLFEASWKDGSIPDLLFSGRSELGLKPYQLLLADADPSGQVYHKVDMTGPTVIVVGSEASGIGAEARAFADKKYIRIPTSALREDLESFNAAVACSILIAEAARQRMM